MKPYRIIIWITAILLLLHPVDSASQSGLFFYRIYFKDKGRNLNAYQPAQLLSERAIARRIKNGVSYPDYRDFPVNNEYISAIKSRGFMLHVTSKWMNTALFSSNDISTASSLEDLPFVSRVEIVKYPVSGKKSADKFQDEFINKAPGGFDLPIRMVNGNVLHEAGYKGKNILIAILDGGFVYADIIESLDPLRKRNGIKYTYDLVKNDKSVFESSDHGTAALSILAGSMPGKIEGSAPDAEFLLLKTEDVLSEFPCEEDFWAAGAELADSAGADIISSSLGYSTFDDPSMNYSQADLDGNTAFVTQVADVAASKGIAVFNSAGNERNNNWYKIVFPSDGDSVISVGAVDGNRLISNFSSAGFSADGRVKPDITAMGVAVPIQTYPSAIITGNGTSFACPVMSGMAACLMQAVPEASSMEVLNAIKESSSMFNRPDYLYGYGIPDMGAAFKSLLEIHFRNPDDEVSVAPNPTSGSLHLVFSNSPGSFRLEIYSLNGKQILSKEYYANGKSVLIDDLANREQGFYIFKIITNEGTLVRRVIKLGK